MQNEFEATFLKIDYDKIIQQLKALQAVQIFPKRLFKRKTYSLGKEGTWLRLRDEGDKITLTYKEINSKNIDGAKEIELVVDNFERTAEFLEKLEYKVNNYSENYREKWELPGVTFDIDSWPLIDTYLEIEGDTPEIVEEYAKKLDLQMSAAIFASVDKIYKENYNIDFNKYSIITFSEQK